MEIENVATNIHPREPSSPKVRRSVGLLGGLVAGLLLWAAPAQAQQQKCAYNFANGFARLASLESRATTQQQADAEVAGLFGPRPLQCEETAYRTFMENFESFARSAMRAPAANRERLLRLAIAVIRQAPAKVSENEHPYAKNQYMQMRSNLSATADDVWKDNKPPIVTQLQDAVAAIGKPEKVDAPPPPTEVTPPPVTNGAVQMIRVPTQPLPEWAVIQLFEARDLVKAQDLSGIQRRLQAVINWMEANAGK